MSKDKDQRAARQEQQKSASKNCKHCYSTIHRKARVCAVCQKTVTYSGELGAFFLTAFPILTAILSLGFALYEKYEKGIVEQEKQVVQHDLELGAIIAEATQTELKELARNDVAFRAVPAVAALRSVSEPLMRGEDGGAGDSPRPAREREVDQVQKARDRIGEIESKIRTLGDKDLRSNKSEIIKLQRNKLKLEYFVDARGNGQ